jgi:small multidrug resistance family-3 protein
MSWILGIVGRFVLFLYGIVPTFQPSHFHIGPIEVFFIVSSIMWGILINKKKSDTHEIIGSFIVLVGLAIIFYILRLSKKKMNNAI